MYVTVRQEPTPQPIASPAAEVPAGGGWRVVGRTVILLGLTSFFTDISAEMVSAVLPLYLVLHLQLPPLAYGVVDGVYQGGAALIRAASGHLSDRLSRYKEVAAAGYGLSALCKLALLIVGGFSPAIAAVVLLDRAGKGIRTAPRDALISLSGTPAGLATAFGVHRAMDTAGALIGPILSFMILARLPAAFDAIFVVSLCAAVIGLGVLILFVANPPAAAVAERSRTTLRAAIGLLRNREFRTVVVAGSVLALATISDGFLYLGLQRRVGIQPGAFPLLYVGASLVYLALAVPLGRVADRWGRSRVFLLGYVLLLPVYMAVWLRAGGGPELLVVCLMLVGAHYAATDGVLMALASATLSPGIRATGLGLLAASVSTCRMLASVAFGVAWTWWGVEQAAGAFGVVLVGAVLTSALALARRNGLVLVAGDRGR